jgi:hypothetical protein
MVTPEQLLKFIDPDHPATLRAPAVTNSGGKVRACASGEWVDVASESAG